LLIHLVDISNPYFPEQIEAVHHILFELELDHIPRLLVFNKEDRLSCKEVEAICGKYEGVPMSALRPERLDRFFLALDRKLWEGNHSTSEASRDKVKLTNEDSFDISNRNFEMGARGNDGNPS